VTKGTGVGVPSVVATAVPLCELAWRRGTIQKAAGEQESRETKGKRGGHLRAGVSPDESQVSVDKTEVKFPALEFPITHFVKRCLKRSSAIGSSMA
jgi:hypothetical protein